MSNGLPATQTDVPQIFLAPDGAPLSVFTQAEDIIGRPRIAKLLKKGGGIISKDPKDADIILVDDGSTTGIQFIKVWSNDGHKVVLRYQWVNACVSARRILREDEEWGGFMTADDGVPLNDDFPETEQKFARSPLPTPRQSPVEPPSSVPRKMPKKASSSKRLLSNGSHVPSSISQSSKQAHSSPEPTDVDGVFPSHVIDVESQVPVAPPNVLIALADVLKQNPSAEPQARAAQIQSIAPNVLSTQTPSRLMDDIEIVETTFHIQTSVSEKARGKQKDANVSRKSSLSRPPPSSSSDTSPTPPRGLFTSSTGSPLKFFVQVGFPRRIEIVNVIKKHGGVIEANMGVADYAILYANAVTNPRDYQHLLNSAIAAGKPAISGQFIHDCIAQGTMLDSDSYTFAPLGKRGRPKPKPRTPSPDSDEEEPLPKKLKMWKQSTPSQSTKPVEQETKKSKSTQIEQSSSQPKPTSAAAKQAIKYTQSEFEFALEEALHLFRTDENASENQLAVIIHAKMPQHSLASWRTFINQTKRNEFQEARKRGCIQYRKKHAELEAAQRMRQSVMQPQRSDEQDIERFSDFLAFEGGDQFDGEDPLGAFRALAEKAPWRSTAGWEEFWSRYNEEIKRRYDPKAEEQTLREQQRKNEDMYQFEDV